MNAIFNFTTGITPARIAVYIMSAIMIIMIFYKGFGNKMETVDDYMHRASSWSKLLAARTRAIKIYQKALLLPNLGKDKKAEINLMIAHEYYKKKDFKTAYEYFEKMKYLLDKKNLPYNIAYASMILCYYKIKGKKEALEIYHNIENRYSYDQRFGVVTTPYNKISK